MVLEYVPRKQLAQRLLDGWSLVPGVDYPPNEYAFLMFLPPVVKHLSFSELRAILRPFNIRDERIEANAKQEVRSNKARGLASAETTVLRKYGWGANPNNVRALLRANA